MYLTQYVTRATRAKGSELTIPPSRHHYGTFSAFREYKFLRIACLVSHRHHRYGSQDTTIYFDREDVKRAIHAPLNVNWTLCTKNYVFTENDRSLPSSYSVLPNVIEKSERAVIVHGTADFILIAEG